MNFRPSLFASLLVAATACGAPPPATVPEPVAQIKSSPAQTEDLPVTVAGFGTVEFDPDGQRTLNAEIEARVLALDALAGERITKEQIVLRLTTSSVASMDVARARRDANTAQAVADRAKRLRADGLASDADVESAVAAARDQLQLAQSLEARAGSVSALRSPIDGVVDTILVEPGDLVAPGTPIARLATSSEIQARIGIEVEDAARLKVGDAVTLMALDKSGAEVQTQIRALDTRVDPTTRMSSALVGIPPGLGFLSGQAVCAEMVAEIRANVVTVPRESVFYDESGTYVFVDDSGKAKLTRVELGETSAGRTEIVSGLTAGDAVVTEGGAILSNGMKVSSDRPTEGPKP